MTNDDLAEVAARVHMSKGRFGFAKFEYFVDHRFDRVLRDEGVHILEVAPRPDKDAGDTRATTDQRHRRNIAAKTRQSADDGNMSTGRE